MIKIGRGPKEKLSKAAVKQKNRSIHRFSYNLLYYCGGSFRKDG